MLARAWAVLADIDPSNSDAPAETGATRKVRDDGAKAAESLEALAERWDVVNTTQTSARQDLAKIEREVAAASRVQLEKALGSYVRAVKKLQRAVDALKE